MVDQSAGQEVHSGSPLCWNNCLDSSGEAFQLMSEMWCKISFHSAIKTSVTNVGWWGHGLCCSPRQFGTSVCCNWPFQLTSAYFWPYNVHILALLKETVKASSHLPSQVIHQLKRFPHVGVVEGVHPRIHGIFLWVQFLDPSVSRLIRDKLNMSRNTQGSFKNRYKVLTLPALNETFISAYSYTQIYCLLLQSQASIFLLLTVDYVA